MSFPVTSSILSAKHLALFLQDKFSLGEQISCELIKSGINDSYILNTTIGKFVFRVYSLGWRTETEILEELDFLVLLHQHNIPVSIPICDKSNQYIQVLHAPEGIRMGVLFSFAFGEKQPNVDAQTHYSIGQVMANFHKISVNRYLNRTTYNSTILLDDSLLKIEGFLSKTSAEYQFMNEAKNILKSMLDDAETDKIRVGGVHLDIWFDNLAVMSEGEITLFDFDFCGNGWLCLDIAYYVLQLHNVEKYEKKEYEPKVRMFLAGYESVIKISEEEKRLIPCLGVSLYFFYLGVQCERYHNWSNSFLNESYLKRFINGLVKRYFDIYTLGEV